MSGIMKSVKKVFKKVVNFVSKAAPIALAAGAMFFTAGSALGLTGGWGSVASSIGNAIGGTGTLGNIITGAVNQAGYGALAGGATALLTGGDITKGAGIGTLLGGASGAATGAAGIGLPEGGDIFPSKPGAPTATGIGTSGGTQIPVAAGGVPTPASTVAGSVPAAAASVAAPASSTVGSFLEKNGSLIGNTVGGLGKGLLSGMAAKDAEAARAKLYAQERADRDADYKGFSDALNQTSGNLNSGNAVGGLAPKVRFRSDYLDENMVYDEKLGRFVPAKG